MQTSITKQSRELDFSVTGCQCPRSFLLFPSEVKFRGYREGRRGEEERGGGGRRMRIKGNRRRIEAV
jgi:hypothetical protein